MANQIGDGSNGLGLLAFSLDWSSFSNMYVGNPLATPFWVACNVFMGFVLIMWVITPIGYYMNVWDTKNFPIYSANVYTTNGSIYQPEAVMTNGRLDEQKYRDYGPMRFTFQFGVTYACAFAILSCMLVHVGIYHGRLIIDGVSHMLPRRLLSRLFHNPNNTTGNDRGVDIHCLLMQRYPKVPDLWYFILFTLMVICAAVTCDRSGIIPWYGLVLATLVGSLFIGPIGIQSKLYRTNNPDWV